MKRRLVKTLFAAASLTAIVVACVDPPPKVPSIPASGLAVRVYVFGASAQDARAAFQALKQNNPTFSVVNEGGDGEILVGLENDSPKCVAPTALCSYKMAYRVRDKSGNVARTGSMSVSANADRCSDLCSKALVNMVVKVVDAAAVALEGSRADAGASEGADAGASAGAAADAAPPPPAKKGAKVPEPPSLMCSVGAGPRLPSEEAERRAAQVEVLKRINVLDQSEYDCLRKAYLDRL